MERPHTLAAAQQHALLVMTLRTIPDSRSTLLLLLLLLLLLFAVALKPDVFEGLRFEITRPLNQNFFLTHRWERPAALAALAALAGAAAAAAVHKVAVALCAGVWLGPHTMCQAVVNSSWAAAAAG
jgi:hypothetical protein